MILDLLSRQRRALISGCAGSGKTTLAAEKASRLAEQGFQVLFVCFNKSLATHLRKRLTSSTNKLRVYHFHGLCIQLARQASILPQAPSIQDEEQQQVYFEHQLPDALVQAVDKLIGVRYDAIIVDEGQDFREEWLIALMMLLHDPDGGIFYLFYDDNQRLYNRSNNFPLDTPPYPLTVNCRTTQQIHKQIVSLYEGNRSALAVRGPRGRPVERVLYSDQTTFWPKLSQLLKRLVQDEQIPNDEIVILTPLRQRSWLWERPISGPIYLANKQPPGPKEIFATTIHDFKGLESPVVILVEIERWPDKLNTLEALLYVACSRACNHLILLQPVHLSPVLQKYFS
jgi:superfamily I DNA/RNA helicase